MNFDLSFRNLTSSHIFRPTNQVAQANQAITKNQSIVAGAKNDKHEELTRDVTYENLDDLEIQCAAADANSELGILHISKILRDFEAAE